MCKVDIPIFVIARGEDVQTEHCTIELLPFTYAFLKINQVINKCYIVSSSIKVLDFAKQLGFVNTHLFNGDVENIEFLGPQHYTYTHKLEWDWCIVLQVNQVSYDPDLLLNVITKINEKYDFITSYNIRWNTKNYELTDDLQFKNEEQINKLSSYKKLNKIKILDNAIFCLKRDFAEKCANSIKKIQTLWEGKKLLIYNDAEYHPVLNNDDVNNIYISNYIFNKTNNIKENSNVENSNITAIYHKLLLSKKKLYTRI